jgi:hypothetical protein
MGAIWQDFRLDDNVRTIKFQVHGGHAAVRLWHNGELVRETRGLDTNGHDMSVTWQVHQFAGDWVRLAVDDYVTDPWGFISVSGFQLAP